MAHMLQPRSSCLIDPLHSVVAAKASAVSAATHAGEDRRHLGARQDHGEPCRALGAHDAVDPRQCCFRTSRYRKQQRGQQLVLRRGSHLAFDGKRGERSSVSPAPSVSGDACRETGCSGGSSERTPSLSGRCSAGSARPRGADRAAGAAAPRLLRSRRRGRHSMQRQRSSRNSCRRRGRPRGHGRVTRSKDCADSEARFGALCEPDPSLAQPPPTICTSARVSVRR